MLGGDWSLQLDVLPAVLLQVFRGASYGDAFSVRFLCVRVAKLAAAPTYTLSRPSLIDYADPYRHIH